MQVNVYFIETKVENFVSVIDLVKDYLVKNLLMVINLITKIQINIRNKEVTVYEVLLIN